jgi:hypothetical protein
MQVNRQPGQRRNQADEVPLGTTSPASEPAPEAPAEPVPAPKPRPTAPAQEVDHDREDEVEHGQQDEVERDEPGEVSPTTKSAGTTVKAAKPAAPAKAPAPKRRSSAKADRIDHDQEHHLGDHVELHDAAEHELRAVRVPQLDGIRRFGQVDHQHRSIHSDPGVVHLDYLAELHTCENQWVYYGTTGSGTAGAETLTVTFSNALPNPSGTGVTVLDVVALGGNSSTAPTFVQKPAAARAPRRRPSRRRTPTPNSNF